VPIPHKASLFFPLPNGNALLYALEGVSSEPEREDLIVETVTARKPQNLIVPVKNYSKTTQRFTAAWEVENAEDTTLFLKGANLFDVPSESHKDYKLNFEALRAGTQKFKLTFTEQDSGEYQFFQFEIKVEDNKEVEELELVSAIRESISHPVVIENPTSEEVSISKSQFSFTNEYLEISPETLTLKPKESREFQINFRPLMISESSTEVLLKNPTLGDFKYQLKLRGTAPTSQMSLAFKCALG